MKYFMSRIVYLCSAMHYLYTFLVSIFLQIVKYLFELLSVYMWEEPLADKNHEETADKDMGVIVKY